MLLSTQFPIFVVMVENTIIPIIYWAMDPEIFSWGYLHPRWYGLCFAGGFMLAYYFLGKIFLQEGRDEYQAYLVFIYVFVGTLVGARLGHVLFYDPGNYLSNPLEILKIWEGGLASHGGAAGIFVALLLYAKKNTDKPFLWTLDRVSVVVPAASAMIRLGNLMNSEIVGLPTDLPWGFVFENRTDLAVHGELVARHPAQLYESICYFLIFAIVWKIYQRYGKKLPAGLTTGVMLTMVFGARFFIEFIKRNQENFDLAISLDMGQLLSIPFVAFGLWLWGRARRQLGPA